MTEVKTGARVLGVAAALAAGVAYGLGGTVSQIIRAQGFEVNHIVIAQFLVAAVVLGVANVVRGGFGVGMKGALKLMAVGVMAVASSFCYYHAIDLMTVGSAVAIQFQYVWIVVLIASLVDRRAPNLWTTISSLVIIVGSIMASGVVDEVLTGAFVLNPLGIVFACGCAVTYGLFIFLNGRIERDKPPISRAFFMVLAGAIVSSAVSFDFYTGSCDIVGLIPGGLVMGLIMGVLPSFCMAIASARLPGGVVAVLTSVELPAAILSGAVVLGEPLSILVAIGAAAILLAIGVSELSSTIGNGKAKLRRRVGESG